MVGRLGPGPIIATRQQRAELEGPDGVATVIGATVSSFCALEAAALFEGRPEIRSAGCVAELVGSVVGEFCAPGVARRSSSILRSTRCRRHRARLRGGRRLPPWRETCRSSL